MFKITAFMKGRELFECVAPYSIQAISLKNRVLSKNVRLFLDLLKLGME
jgi:hypothetical protein